MTQALADMRELRNLSLAQGFDLFVFLRELGDGAALIIGTNVDDAPAIAANHAVDSYQIPKGVKALLAALRSRMPDIDPHEVVGGSS
jgi:hypothetical protein